MPDNDSTDNDSNWAYKPDENVAASIEPAENPSAEQKKPQEPITWTASEFIDTHKGAGWHVLFFAGLAALGGLAYFLTKDYISSAVIIIAGIIFALTINRKPRQLPYEINNQGIQIGERFYDYGMFKSFDLMQEGGIKSINLMPLKRLMPDISLYFPPEQETAIVDFLSAHLPHDEHIEKSIDRLAKKLRF